MSQAICIVGVPMDLGQSRRGVDMGPSALRYAGLDQRLAELGCVVNDCGNVAIPIRESLPPEGGLAYLPSVVQACEAVYEAGKRATTSGEVPIFLGGDHSIAMGTVAAATEAGPTGVIWVDAHGDFNTPESSPSGNIHGMPLAALTGRGVPELVNIGRPGPTLEATDVVLIGIRDLDPLERDLLKASQAGVYTMREIDERGLGRVAAEALGRLSHCSRVHVSLDMDSLDPREAPGVGTPEPGGLTYREAHLLMETIAATGKLGSLDVVEINPILDARNRTAELAVELVASVLGQTIL